MKRRRMGNALAGVVVVVSLSTAVGLGGASAATRGFRTSAGTYTLHVTFTGHHAFTATLVLTTAHTFTVSGGGPAGTWTQPGLAGTIVLRGTDGDVHYTFSAYKFDTSLGVAGEPGTFSADGTAAGTWYALLTG